MERGRVFLDQLAGSEGADEWASKLDEEIAELERRAEIADSAAARYPMLQGEHHEQQHADTWSAARRRASS